MKKMTDTERYGMTAVTVYKAGFDVYYVHRNDPREPATPKWSVMLGTVQHFIAVGDEPICNYYIIQHDKVHHRSDWVHHDRDIIAQIAHELNLGTYLEEEDK